MLHIVRVGLVCVAVSEYSWGPVNKLTTFGVINLFYTTDEYFQYIYFTNIHMYIHVTYKENSVSVHFKRQKKIILFYNMNEII